MSVITKNTRIKTDLISSKISEYLNKHKKKLKKDNSLFELRKKDKRVKDHRIVFSKSELAEINDLILREKAKQIIRDVYFEGIPETQDRFKLSNTMNEFIRLPRQSLEISVSSMFGKDIKPDSVKMRANTFISKIKNNSQIIETKINDDETRRLSNLNLDIIRKSFSKNKINEKVIKKDKEIKINYKKQLDIVLNKGVTWNIKINETSREDVIKIMKNYSSVKSEKFSNSDFIIYSDVSITVLFDKNKIVKEIELNEEFKGISQEGLRIGDSCDKAVKLYGSPKADDGRFLIWDDFKIFYWNNKINSIITLTNKLNFIFEKNSLTKDFIVYTQGALLGLIIDGSTKSIIVGGNNKSYVINFMKDYSNTKFKSDLSDNYLCYEDVSIEFYFDEKDILNSIEMGENFKGKTLNELKIDDSITKAIKIYGKPFVIEKDFLGWDKLKLFCENSNISKIKIQK